ncbi:MAG TPA: hypothetical protein VEU51_00420 [Candidatus Acidoferrales bacterium]|nr:hypothetical protein [Candidatus Acidoferrales bacterium]
MAQAVVWLEESMVRRMIFSLVAGFVLLMTATGPAQAVTLAPEITFQAPATRIKHITSCKSGMPPCDTFKVVAQFQVTNDIDLDNDLSNQEVAIFFGNGLVCNPLNINGVFELDVPAGMIVKKTTAASVKYSFKGTTDAFDYNTSTSTMADLNLTISINSKGKGLLKASGTGDFAGITSSPIIFALVPFNEPDSDNNISGGDYNCGVATAKIINQWPPAVAARGTIAPARRSSCGARA